MSIPAVHPCPVSGRGHQTMAQVWARLADDPALSGRKRSDLSWALRTVCRAFQLDLETLPACPRHISERLEGFAPATIGLGEGAWVNALSLTRFALRRVGIIKKPARQTVPFAPEWTQLFALCPKDQRLIGLSRLARFCTSNDISPEDVDDTVFERLREEMVNGAVMVMARKRHRRAIVIWNEMAGSVRFWPSQRVTVPSYSRVYALGWEAFPKSLITEVEAHLRRLSGADVLSVLDLKPLKLGSIKTRRQQLHAYVSALVLQGEPIEELQGLIDIVTVPRAREGLTFFISRAEEQAATTRKQVSYAQPYEIARVLLSIAKYDVQADETDLKVLRGFIKNLQRKHAGMTDKNRERLRQFDDGKRLNFWRLHTLPQHLVVEAARAEGRPTQADALLVQTALAIEILLMIPIRRHNLVELDLERHLKRSQGGEVHLIIPGAEVKNGMPIEAKLPSDTKKLFDLYVSLYRPLLVRQPSAWLFPGVADHHKSRERMAAQVSVTILKKLGLQMNVHLFRALSAKFYLDQNPGAYGVVQRMHGHKYIGTTINSYTGMEQAATFKNYAETVLNHRKSAKPSLKQKPKK